MPTLLVVDDEPNVLYSLEKALGSDTLRVRTARTAREGIEAIQEQKPDAVILDVRLPDLSGLEAFDQMRGIDPRLPVIVITAHAATETAIEAMKRGAFEYLLKPVDLPQLRGLVAKALELSRLRHVPAVFEESPLPDTAADHIVGRSAAMQEVYKAVGRVAGQNMAVLITGESGTGKELVARAIYHHSDRSQGPFLVVSCAAIPEALLESELFGHERGAFAGADRQRIGKLEQAGGGTLFLDEIGDLAPATQAKLQRLLEEQRFERVGGSEPLQADIRLIAATGQELEGLVRAGGFRRDLFYRLKTFTIHLPPLRERREDLPLLVDYFLKRAGRELGRPACSVSPDALRSLMEYDWPGNVRELQSVLGHARVRAAGDVLTPECLPVEVWAGSGGCRPEAAAPLDVAEMVAGLLRNGEADTYRKVCQAVDQVVIGEALRQAGGNQVVASERLGISRTTLRNKLRALGLAVEKQLSPHPEQEE